MSDPKKEALMPSMIVNRLALAVLAAMALATPAEARVKAKPAPVKVNAAPVQDYFRNALLQADFVGRGLEDFETIAAGAAALSIADLDARDEVRKAAARGDNLGMALRYDLDGDLRVTSAEVKRARLSKRSQTAADRMFARLDADADGVLAVPEVVAVSDAAYQPEAQVTMLRAVVPIAGRKGVLKRTAFKTYLTRAFAAADTDRDGMISETEYAALQPAAVAMAGASPVTAAPASVAPRKTKPSA
jgi:EF hand